MMLPTTEPPTTQVLRLDRLAEVTESLATAIEQADVSGLVPRNLAPVVKVARMVGLDVIALLRAEAASSVRRLTLDARSAPARADAVATWLVHVVAYLTDQTDEPPPRPTMLG